VHVRARDERADVCPNHVYLPIISNKLFYFYYYYYNNPNFKRIYTYKEDAVMQTSPGSGSGSIVFEKRKVVQVERPVSSTAKAQMDALCSLKKMDTF
jgi:hypothetical protein